MFKLMIVAAGALTMAGAATAESLPQAKVFHGDLNLATASGQKTLAGRIEQAGEKICGSESVVDLDRRMMISECRAAVRDSAKPQVREAIIAAGGGSSMRGLAAQSVIIGN